MTDKKEKQSWFSLDMLQPLDWLLLAVPLAFAIRFVPIWKNETLLFIIAGLAIIPLAELYFSEAPALDQMLKMKEESILI